MLHPVADRSVAIPSIVVRRTCSNEVHVATLRSLHPPLEVQEIPAALSWLVAWECVRNVAALAGAATHRTSAAVRDVRRGTARVMCRGKTPPGGRTDAGVPGRGARWPDRGRG